MLTRSNFYISAPWRSSGKTIVSLGLSAAFRRRGLTVQTFKKGPDYIDPLWLREASERQCYNLDPFMQTSAEVLATYQRYSAAADVNLIEGTMGLHDGLARDGSDSNAAVARQLASRVILVVDCRGMHRTVAALVNGIQIFDPQVNFVGVLLNRIRTSRHEEKICAALAQYTDMRVIGAIAESQSLLIDEKELGLVPAIEQEDSNHLIESAATIINQSCDLDYILEQRTAIEKVVDHTSNPALVEDKTRSSTGSTVNTANAESARLTVGIARDAAFQFYYADDLEALENRGVQLLEVSPLSGRFPKQLDALLIGGGFPERYAEALAANTAFRSALNRAIQAGLPVRAECGGMMYLCRSLQIANCNYPMVGVLAGDVTLCKKPQGRGYVQLRIPGQAGLLHAHEFHHSTIHFDKPCKFEYGVHRGHGIDGKHDGVRVHNTLATYAHFRHTESTPWVDSFVEQIKGLKSLAGFPQHV